MIAIDVYGMPTMETRTISPADTLSDTSVSNWVSPAGGAEAGGDWCDVVTISEEMVALTIGDVSGHGAAVAGTMAAMRAAVLRSIYDIRVPSEILAVVNDVALSRGDGVIVTAIVAFFNNRRHTLTFANAGHPPPLLLSNAFQAFLTHPPADLPLGIVPHYGAADYVIALPYDALLVLYTDGITEHDRDPIQGETDLSDAARFAYDWPDVDAADAIAQQIFRKGPGHDDAAALVLRTTRNTV